MKVDTCSYNISSGTKAQIGGQKAQNGALWSKPSHRHRSPTKRLYAMPRCFSIMILVCIASTVANDHVHVLAMLIFDMGLGLKSGWIAHSSRRSLSPLIHPTTRVSAAQPGLFDRYWSPEGKHRDTPSHDKV